MSVTKTAIERLLAAPIQVKLVNGAYQVASVVAHFSRYAVELQVEVTHPSLVWQCGNHQAVILIRWEGSTGKALAIPAELDPLVEALKRAAALSDETAQRMADENRRAFQQVFQSLAIPKAA